MFTKNAVLPDCTLPVPAVITVSGPLIDSVVPVSEEETFESASALFGAMVDYSEYYVCPGVIDLNVQCNGKWDPLEEITGHALAAGTTLLVEHPNLQGHHDRSETLYCDVGHLVGVLDGSEMPELGNGFGYKCFVSQPSFALEPSYSLPEILGAAATQDVPVFIDTIQHDPLRIREYSPYHVDLPEARDENATPVFPHSISAGVLADAQDSASEDENDMEFYSPSTHTKSAINSKDIQAAIELARTIAERRKTQAEADRAEVSSIQFTRFNSVRGYDVERDLQVKEVPAAYRTVHDDIHQRARKQAAGIEIEALAETSSYSYSAQASIDVDRQTQNQAQDPEEVKSPEPKIVKTNTVTPAAPSFLNRRANFRKGLSAIVTMQDASQNVKLQTYFEWLASCSRGPQTRGLGGIKHQLLDARDTRIHLCGLAEPQAVSIAFNLKQVCPRLSIEVTMNHLLQTAQEIQDGDTRLKMYPAIRSKNSQNLLWECLKLEMIDAITSMHNKVDRKYKFRSDGDFKRAIPGVDCAGYLLPGVWSRLRRPLLENSDNYKHYIVRLFKYLSTNPAEVLGVQDQRGSIAAGFCADLVVWRPDWTYAPVVTNRASPYADTPLKGAVSYVYLRGQLVADCNGVTGLPIGQRVGPQTRFS